MTIDWSREEIREWARRNRVLSPWFTQAELERVLVAAENQDANREAVEHHVARHAFETFGVKIVDTLGSDHWPKEAVSEALQELCSDPVATFLASPSCQTTLEKLFVKFSDPHRFETPFSETGEMVGKYRGITVSNFLNCIRYLELGTKPSVAALNFRRSGWAIRLSDTPHRHSLCFPEFIEALARCVCATKTSTDRLQTALENIKEMVSFAQQKMNQRSPLIDVASIADAECKTSSGPLSPTSHGAKKFLDRPLTPRRKNSFDLSRWPHSRDEGLEVLGHQLERVRARKTEDVSNQDFYELLDLLRGCERRFGSEDIFVQQRLIPGLADIVKHLLHKQDQARANLLVPFLLIACSRKDAFSDELLPDNDAGTFAKWIACQTLQLVEDPFPSCKRRISFGEAVHFVWRLLERAKTTTHFDHVFDTVIAHPVLAANVFVPYLQLLCEQRPHTDGLTAAEVNTNWILSMGVLLGNHVRKSACAYYERQLVENALAFLLETLRYGTADIRICAWAIRQCGPRGIRSLGRVAHFKESCTVYSARARKFACWALSLPMNATSVFRVCAQRHAISFPRDSPKLFLEQGNECIPANKASISALTLEQRHGENGLGLFLTMDMNHLLERVNDALHELCLDNQQGENNLQLNPAPLNQKNREEEEDGEFPACVEQLIQAVQGDPETKVVASAARALGILALKVLSDEFFFSSGLFDVLCDRTKDKDCEIRQSCVEALGNLAPRFRKVLLDSPPEQAPKHRAFKHLDRITKCIIDVLETDAVWKVRLSAVLALGQFGRTTANHSIPAIVKAMTKGRIRHAAAGLALSHMGSRGLQVLCDMARKQSLSSQVRVAAIKGLSTLDPTENTTSIRFVIDCLYNCTDDCISAVRGAALEALGKLASHAKTTLLPSLSVRTLHPMLYCKLLDPCPKCARIAAETLAKLMPEGELLLVRAMNDKTFPVHGKVAALHGLDILGPHAAKTLVAALQVPALEKTCINVIRNHLDSPQMQQALRDCNVEIH